MLQTHPTLTHRSRDGGRVATATCRTIAMTTNAGVGVRLKPGQIMLCVSDFRTGARKTPVRRGGGYVGVGQPVYASAKYAWAWREETTMFSSPSWRPRSKSSEPGTVCSMEVIQ